MKPVPTINVNLTPCNCGLASRTPTYPPTPHQDHCSGKPILIPCRLHESFTCDVVLGECACQNVVAGGMMVPGAHHVRCPARPVRVSCSISGKTWEQSFPVADWDMVTERFVGAYRPVVWPAITDRWALVKALVTGGTEHDIPEPLRYYRIVARWVHQRNEVYAALADMARLEEALHNAAGRSATALRACGARVERKGVPLFAPTEHDLTTYVRRMIEQVGALS